MLVAGAGALARLASLELVVQLQIPLLTSIAGHNNKNNHCTVIIVLHHHHHHHHHQREQREHETPTTVFIVVFLCGRRIFFPNIFFAVESKFFASKFKYSNLIYN
jgi:hypothetical protein